jgi:hypothetical protein
MFRYGSVTNIVWNAVWLAVAVTFLFVTGTAGPLWLFIVWYLIYLLDVYNFIKSIGAYMRVKKARK